MRRLAILLLALAGSLAAFPNRGVAALPGHARGSFALTVSGGIGVPLGRLAAGMDPHQVVGEASYDAHDVFIHGTFIPPDLAGGTGLAQQPGAGFGASADYFVTDGLAVGVDFSMVTFAGKDVVLPADLPGDFVLNAAGEVISCQPLGRPVSLPAALKAGGFQVGIHGRYFVSTGTPLRPYGRVGLGLYGRRIEAADGAAEWLGWSEQADSRFGVSGGLGADWRVAERLSLVVAGTYHLVPGKFEQDVPNSLYPAKVRTTLAGDWSYLAFDVGLTCPIPGLR